MTLISAVATVAVAVTVVQVHVFLLPNPLSEKIISIFRHDWPSIATLLYLLLAEPQVEGGLLDEERQAVCRRPRAPEGEVM